MTRTTPRRTPVTVARTVVRWFGTFDPFGAYAA